MRIVPVIMAGGAGTRLWPMSNDEKPKQFHNLSGNGTLLEETINRLKSLSPEEIMIVTAKAYDTLSLDEIKKSGLKGEILCEPRPRNTAAAIYYSAFYLNKIYPESIMIALPADHYIKNEPAFTEVLNLAVKEAEKGKLVTIGIKPTYPETGYGYIQSESGSGKILNVERFVEKPDIEKAKKYIASGNFFWNSGIFIWRTDVIISEFVKQMPKLVNAFKKLDKFSSKDISMDSDIVWKTKNEIFNEIDSVSIDSGILENAQSISVIPGDFGWADLGSWKAADDILPCDENCNRTPVKENTIFVHSKGCSSFSEECSVAIVGLSNVVVVQSGKNILVMNKDSSQDVRKVVEIVRKR
jgi:mannose-1-phosphate guanylyltransferase